MRRLLAGLVGIAVVAGALAWFAQGVAVGQDPGEPDHLSWEVMTLQIPEDAYSFGEPSVLQVLPSNKYEDFEDPQNWPNDWLLLATHEKFWGPNQCLAVEGDYDGWVEAWGSLGHPSHHDPPNCASPTGYNDDFLSWMTYGPFPLTNKTKGSVSFQFLLDTEFEHDTCGVYASIDGSSFYGASYWGDSGDWVPWPPEHGDFSDWPSLGNILDEPQVWVAFVFASDDSHTGTADKGCFLDNINIWTSVDETPTPETPTPCPMCGDVNCDSAVDAVDAMFILQYVVGLRGELCVPCCPGP